MQILTWPKTNEGVPTQSYVSVEFTDVTDEACHLKVRNEPSDDRIVHCRRRDLALARPMGKPRKPVANPFFGDSFEYLDPALAELDASSF
jgi:hypothetical protein